VRVLALGFAALVASAPPAFARDIMANYYGNTLVASSAATDLRIHYRADHTFDAAGTNASGRVAFRGKWSLDRKGELCRVYDTQGRSKPVCTPWSAHRIGDTWELPGVTLTLEEGVQ